MQINAHNFKIGTKYTDKNEDKYALVLGFISGMIYLLFIVFWLDLWDYPNETRIMVFQFQIQYYTPFVNSKWKNKPNQIDFERILSISSWSIEK